MCDIYLDMKYQETIYNADKIAEWVAARKQVIGNRALNFVAAENDDVLELWIGRLPDGRQELVVTYYKKHKRLPPS